MFVAPCLCGCGGNGHGHRCRTPLESCSTPEPPDRRDWYDAFTDRLDSELHRLSITRSPPRRTSEYALFVRGCLEFEQPTPSGYCDYTPSQASPVSTAESGSLRLLTPDEDQHGEFNPIIASSASPQDYMEIASAHHDISQAKSTHIPDLYKMNSAATSSAITRSMLVQRKTRSE